jgi:hypothetical protein
MLVGLTWCGVRAAAQEAAQEAPAQIAPMPFPEDFTQFDNRPYAAVLTRFVDERGLVDYAGLKANREQLDAYVAALGKLEPMTYNAWSGAAKMALWINAYNAITLKIVIDHYPPRKAEGAANPYPANSVRQIAGMWDRLRTNIMGQGRTLDEIEHGVLRKEFADARLHMALVCATRGAPALRNEPYDAKRLDDQLALQARRFVSDPGKVLPVAAENKVRLSPIFDWFGQDFVSLYERQAPTDPNPTPRSAVLWFVSQNSDALAWTTVQNWQVEWLPYDWRLNSKGE